MKSSEQLGELFGALAKTQSLMGAALKDSSNPFFSSKFADMKSVVEVSRGPLTENNLCVTQPPIKEEWGAVLLTILGHNSGQWIASEIEIKPMKKLGRNERKEDFIPGPEDDPQKIGAYITYMRRYAYVSIVGIVTEDDDGETASGRGEAVNRHMRKVDELMMPIKNVSPDPKITLEKLLTRFKVGHHYKLEESQLFDAACFVIDLTKKQKD